MLKERKIRSLLISAGSDSGARISDDHVLQKNMHAFFQGSLNSRTFFFIAFFGIKMGTYFTFWKCTV